MESLPGVCEVYCMKELIIATEYKIRGYIFHKGVDSILGLGCSVKEKRSNKP